jgi:hypothetical protein
LREEELGKSYTLRLANHVELAKSLDNDEMIIANANAFSSRSRRNAQTSEFGPIKQGGQALDSPSQEGAWDTISKPPRLR